MRSGSRTILKLVYTPTLEKTANFYDNLDTFDPPERQPLGTQPGVSP